MNSAVYLWSIGERRCQGYSAVPAQGTIDDDSINLGQIQWGTLSGHAHITGGVLSVWKSWVVFVLQSSWSHITFRTYYIIFMERREVVYVLRNQNNYDQKCNFSSFGPQKTAYWAAREKNLVILSFTYSVLYCFLFVEEKKPTSFINCSVSGNRKPRNSSWIYMRFWLGCQVWFNSRRPFRDGPAVSTRDEMKPPVIKAMHILFTVVVA